jgi:hypothetical protein
MLAVFRRYLFRLTEYSVALALHSCLGGTPAGFHVCFASDRHFRFSVANKHVGYLIRNLKRVTNEHFDVYFYLWRDGGDDWVKEKRRWEKEEENSWTVRVSRKSKRQSAQKRVSFHHKLVQDSPIFKSSPRELSSVIKIGSIYCPISDNRCTVQMNLPSSSLDEQTSVSISNGVQTASLHGGDVQGTSMINCGDVPVRKVFQNLRKDLFFRFEDIQATSKQQPEVINAGSSFKGACSVSHVGFHVPSLSRCCFKCLSPSHLVRDCCGQLRCLFCFNYGHKARFCAKRRESLNYKWILKPDKPSSQEKAATNPIQWSFGPNAPSNSLHPSPPPTDSLPSLHPLPLEAQVTTNED